MNRKPRRRRRGSALDDIALARREPVWLALSTLWLDSEPTPRELAGIAGVLHDSGFGLDELRAIYLYEVAPVMHGNLNVVAGAWSGFDEPWLYGKAKRRAEHRSVWLRVPVVSAWRRRRMTSATEPYWHIVVGLLERMRSRAAISSPPA